MSERLSMGERTLQSRDAIELLRDKWRITILHLLTTRPQRHNELQRALVRVSPKMLTQTLRRLERDGLIGREVHQVIPPHVEYSLTPMAKSLIPLLRDLCRWAKANAQSRDEARHNFDLSAKKNGNSVRARVDEPIAVSPDKGKRRIRMNTPAESATPQQGAVDLRVRKSQNGI